MRFSEYGFDRSAFGFGGGGGIKSIQHGLLSMAGTSANVTITEVDTTKAIIIISSFNNEGMPDAAARYVVRASITSSTNINFVVQTASVYTQIAWTVVEFNNVKLLQKGTFTQAGGVGITKSISQVNVNKSLLFYSFTTESTATNITQILSRAYIEDSTTLSFSFPTGSNVTCNWQLVEFN